MPIRALCIAFDGQELTTRLAIALARDIEVGLMVPWSPSMPELDWKSLRIDFQPFEKPRLRQPWRRLRMMRLLLDRIRRFNPDVIHMQKGDMYFSLALLVLRQYPLVISIHDPKHHIGDMSARNELQPLINLAYRRADQIIVHNQQMRQEVIKTLGIREDVIHIIPLVERGNPEDQQHVAEAGNEILFFGRIWRYKGLEYLIRAEPLISEQAPGAKIVIAGTGEVFSRYEAMMVHRSHFIVYNEYISAEKQAELFHRASVVVLPYIEATQSGVIPVAYNFSKPVVASAVGGLPSQVDHGHTGLLVPPGDVRELADAIVRLMRDEPLRHRLGANGRQKLEVEWSASVVARQTLPVYDRAIAHTGSRRLRGSA